MNKLLTVLRDRWFHRTPSTVPDAFPDMRSLLSRVQERDNYEFDIRMSSGSTVKIFAPHGGCIEPGTAPIVRELAGNRYDYFIFRGTRKGGGCKKLLHVKSTHYDEERCQSMVRDALFSLSVHGCKGRRRRIEIGGGNSRLAADLYETLKPDYPVSLAPDERSGRNPLNFINVSRYQGVQLELSEGFRYDLFLDYPKLVKANPRTFPEFIETLRKWLRKVEDTLVT